MASLSRHTPASVLSLATALVTRPPSLPLAPATAAHLFALCQGLREVGARLEEHHAPTLDSLQALLTALCQDRALDIALRLVLLEVVELRSLGWRSNPSMEAYYRERFTKLGGERSEGGRPQAPVAEVREERMVVRGAALAISSSSPAALAAATKVLKEFFARREPVLPQVVRSREEILALATSPLSLAPPADWGRLVKALPSVVVRAKVEDRGDTTATLHPPPLFPTNPTF